MSYYDVVVHVDNSDACSARLATAIAVAKRYGAHLHGCCVVPPVNLAFYGEGAMAVDLVQAALDQVDEDLRSAKAKFIEAVAETGLTSECAAVQGQPGTVVAETARNADLAIVGQPDPDDARCTSSGVAAAVAFGAGCGVLVHPSKGNFVNVGSRVLVAWDGSREAQRAVRDALPVLASAEHVEVVSVLSDKLPDSAGDEPAGKLCGRLARRGIQARAHYVSAADEAAGDILIARCSQVQANLMVLGAYGHSRLREFLLGGVTRQVLHDHPLPVFVSH